MLAFSSLGLACLALLSVARAAPTDGTPTGELAKRFVPSAANTCYYTCPPLNGVESDANYVVGSQTYCNYPEPDVICRYFSNNGIAVSGYYNSNDNLFYDCPAAATSHGPCNGAPAAKRSFGKSLSPLEQKLKDRQWSSKKAAARAEKKGAVAWLKK